MISCQAVNTSYCLPVTMNTGSSSHTGVSIWVLVLALRALIHHPWLPTISSTRSDVSTGMHALVLLVAFRQSFASLSIPSFAVFCPLVVLGCWILCTAGSAVWEALTCTNLESWLPAVPYIGSWSLPCPLCHVCCYCSSSAVFRQLHCDTL